MEGDTSNSTTVVSTDEETGVTTITTTTTSTSQQLVQDDLVAATELWQYSALGKRSSGQDYFLDLDDDGEITVRSNTDSLPVNSTLAAYASDVVETEYYIVPEYLRYSGKYDFYENSWEEDAMELYENDTPFYLDFTGSRPKAKAIDYTSMMIDDLLSAHRADQLRLAQVSLLW